ncbi:MAG: 50S ribosomal protein L2, partial [Promethearchaeota archaeon]
MGKRILAQRKGQGNLWARSPSHRHVGQVKYRPFKQDEDQFKFKVIELIHSPGRGAPVARVKYND